MLEILTRAGCFIAIILLGYALRRIGFYKKEDFHVLSRTVIKVTLSATIITNFAGRELDSSMFSLTAIGFAFGLLLMLVAYVLYSRDSNADKAFAMLNIAGCNIGCFVLPFLQSFLGPVGVMTASLFDMGNSVICLGVAFSIASTVKDGGSHFSVKRLLRALSTSVPLITYILMTIVCLLHITLPAPLLQVAGTIGNANAFLAMLMLGVGYELSGNMDQIVTILRILVPRYAVGIALSVATFFLLPFALEIRQALALLFLSPISGTVPGFTAEMDSDYGLSSAINSISILTSIVLLISALVLVMH